jgi:hypothetical protein
VARSREEIIEACDWLERDYGSGLLQEANYAYQLVYHLNDVPNISPELTRGRTVTNPTPRLSEWIDALSNQLISYQSFPVATAKGEGLTPTEVDKLEAMLAVILTKCRKGNSLDASAYRAFGLKTHVIYQLVCGSADDQVPFDIRLPNINTCFFERFEGGVPEMMARRYDVLVKDAVARYSGKKNTPGGAKKKLTYDKATKRLGWDEIGDDAISGEYYMGSTPMTSQEGFAERLHVREFHDQSGSYHVITSGEWDDKQAQQEVVYEAPNITGAATPFAVIPSSIQEHDMWAEDWKPKGWPGYSRVLQINRIETIRATRAEHVQDHIIQRLDPNQADAINKLKQAGFAPVLHGGVNFLPIPADEIIQWTTIPDADLLERSKEKKDELERWVSSFLLPATEQTISQSNVGSMQIGLTVIHQNEAGFITGHARGMGHMAEMIVNGLAGAYLGDRSYANPTSEPIPYGPKGAKNLEPGKAISVSAATMKKVQVFGNDANILVEFVTRSETESELEQREAGVWNDYQRGIATLDDVIAVRFPDVTGQHKKMADDGVKKALGQTYDQAIPLVAAARNRLRFGVDVSSLLPGAAPPPPGPGSAPGGGTTVTQAAPSTGGMDVSSGGGPAPAGAMA